MYDWTLLDLKCTNHRTIHARLQTFKTQGPPKARGLQREGEREGDSFFTHIGTLPPESIDPTF